MGEAGDPLALVEVSILLGEVLQDSGRIEEALERYREALIISEANDLRMQIGELLARLGGAAPDRPETYGVSSESAFGVQRIGCSN